MNQDNESLGCVRRQLQETEPVDVVATSGSAFMATGGDKVSPSAFRFAPVLPWNVDEFRSGASQRSPVLRRKAVSLVKC